jgi:hypothetical protein
MVRSRVSRAALAAVVAVSCADESGGGSGSGSSGADTEPVASEGGSESSGASGGPGMGSSEEGVEGEGSSEEGGPGSSEGEETGSGACTIGGTPSSEVVTIGDSYFAITPVITGVMVHARLNGSLDPQEDYRRYEVGGTQMGNGQIPGMFDDAVGEDPNIDTVIMTGGGNDVLIGGANICLTDPPPSEPCLAALDGVFGAAEQLIADMAAAGVQHVVYSFYPHLPPGFPPGAKNETLDYAAPIVEELCTNAPVDCHFVDIREAFEGHPEYITGDAIHPTDAGAQVIADLIWATMEENCIAQ